jgi:DNA topoisomerase-1
MAKSLVIVESPTKAKTIKKYLGRNYEVHATMGHIKDLPKSVLGVDIDDGFAPHYSVKPEKRETVKKLRKLAESADRCIWRRTRTVKARPSPGISPRS